MTGSLEKIQVMRDRQLTRSLRAVAVLGFLALLGSVSRVLHVGWNDVMYLHGATYVIILLSALMSRHLSFLFRALIITGAALVLGIAGLYFWGLVAFGIPSLFAFCMLSTILFGDRVGLVSAIVSIIIIGIIGTGMLTGMITIDFNPETYLMSFTSWVSAMLAMALSAGLIVVALGTMNRQMIELVDTLDNRNRELEEVNKRLKKEMKERAMAEKERREIEERLRRAKKMEAVGLLAGGVAHDLNNVLVGTVSYPDVLLMRLPEESPLRKPLEVIKKTGVKAAAIVRDLLTLARGGMVAKDVISMNDVILEYLHSPEFKKMKSYYPTVAIEADLDETMPNIIGSSVHLSTLIMNLVSNAIEAMPKGGKLTISTVNRQIREGIKGYEEIEAGDYVIVKLTDTGIGMASEEMERIFEPFYTKKVMGRSGTGLGMAVVWGTLKDHNGYIDIQSNAGHGTAFTLYFPATRQQKAMEGSQAITQEDYRGKGEAVLVVDDVKEQREVASNMLSALGYSVDSVSSGEEAIRYLEGSFVDLLLLDMLMEPGLDGLETYREIAKRHPGQKAVIVSGYSETERVKEAQRLGAGAYIKKPYLLHQMGLAVRNELDN
ncbi:MAG: response regulator [Deltaproteobacteria bacterium]|nr:response regulator [Deltaproteobacteria bacterium]